MGCTGGSDVNNPNERGLYEHLSRRFSLREMAMSPRVQDGENGANNILSGSQSLPDYMRNKPNLGDVDDIPQSRSDLGPSRNGRSMDDESSDTVHTSNVSNRRRKKGDEGNVAMDVDGRKNVPEQSTNGSRSTCNKSHCSDGSEEEPYIMSMEIVTGSEEGDEEEVHMSFRAGLFWLLIITLSISAMSDILVDTIDGFAFRMHISEVFTSLVILPYFSNIAEQVSALIFAYRNEMDLCVGISVGSAVQIACCVLPGSVLIGWAMDRSMSLFFR